MKTTSLEHALSVLCEGHPRVVRVAMAMLEKYQDRYDDSEFKPSFIEWEFTARVADLEPVHLDPRTDNEVVTCRPDLVFTRVDSPRTAYVVDYKSQGIQFGQKKDGTMPPWNPEETEWNLSWQVMYNMHLVAKDPRYRDQLEPAGFIIERISRQSPYGGDRNDIIIREDAMAEMPWVIRERVREELDSINRCVTRKERPIPNYDACMTRWGPCDYFHVCSASGEERKQVLRENFVKIGLPKMPEPRAA